MHFLTKRDSTNAPDQDERPLTENIDTGFGVLHGCGIGCGTVHRELNTREPPSTLCRRRFWQYTGPVLLRKAVITAGNHRSENDERGAGDNRPQGADRVDPGRSRTSKEVQGGLLLFRAVKI